MINAHAHALTVNRNDAGDLFEKFHLDPDKK
jgi:hypothetical protein